MTAPAYPLDAEAFASVLLEIAADEGTAAALAALGENWNRLDSTGPVSPLLRHWSTDYSLTGLRSLLMDDTDRHAEEALRLSRKRLRVYRTGETVPQARTGLVWHRLRRHAIADGREIGARFLAVATLKPNTYAAVKYGERGGRIRFLVLPEHAPTVLDMVEIGGRRA